jgi:chromosome partitioning protein
MLTFNALCAADSVIIPTQPEFLSEKGLEQLIGTIGRIKKRMNPSLRIDGILLTMHEMDDGGAIL